MASSSDRDKDQNTPTPTSGNPFIRFKQFADAQISSFLQGVVGLPSALSSKPSENARWADIDENLRRRDELQARQKDLKESECRKRDQQFPLADVANIPAKRSQGRGHFSNCKGRSEAYRQQRDDDTRDLPLFSSVSKSLFANLHQPTDGEVDWDSMNESWDRRFLSDYFPYKLRQDQASTDPMRSLQYMVYNDLNSSPQLRSEYSLLPYLMFSSYSPLRLRADAVSGQTVGSPDNFPYLAAFENLIETTLPQQSSTLQSRLFSFYSLGHRGIKSINHTADMAWIFKLYHKNLLQEKQIKTLSHLPAPLSFLFDLEQKMDEHVNKAFKVENTEQDMYDRFLRRASDPNTFTEHFESLIKAAEEAFTKSKSQEAPPDTSELPYPLREVLELMVDSGEKPPTAPEVLEKQNQEAISATKSEKPVQDPDRAVFTSTTTERTTHEGGSVETRVTVWKRFADGRETTTHTTHVEEPAWNDNAEISEKKLDPEQVTKVETKKNGKTGWFWN